MSNNNKIQALLIDAETAAIELQSYGLNTEEIWQFARQNLVQIIKLRNIPLSLKTALEEELKTRPFKYAYYPGKERQAGSVNAILAGTTDALDKAASLLKLDAKSIAVGEKIDLALAKLRKPKPAYLRLGNHLLPLGKRTLIMGILNITPDSFSDGSRFYRVEQALTQAYKMADEGADIIDIGGESTRPGSKQIEAEEELKRVMPVIEALKKDSSFKLPLSIDTYKAVVAERALAAGVEMLNDVWGLKEDRALGQVAANFGVPICLMHNRRSTDYTDLVADIIAELEEAIERAQQAGIDDNKIIIDPGIGFGKDLQQNLDVMKRLPIFCNLGYPLLLGTSRKSMIGKTLDLPVEERLEGTAATVAYGISAGIDIIRVHDIKQMRRTAVMTDAMIRR